MKIDKYDIAMYVIQVDHGLKWIWKKSVVIFWCTMALMLIAGFNASIYLSYRDGTYFWIALLAMEIFLPAWIAWDITTHWANCKSFESGFYTTSPIRRPYESSSNSSNPLPWQNT